MLQKLFNFLLYSNIYIALCALAATWQTTYLLEFPLSLHAPIYPFVFFATWLIYALHRLLSLRKLPEALKIERFQVIGHYQKHIWIYAAFAALGTAWFFFQLHWKSQLLLCLPALLSLGYVLPFLGKQKRRLRDIHFIKIFLVAFVWAAVTGLLPAVEANAPLDTTLWLLVVERTCFVFAITLPFDIRDLELDQKNRVKTIPAVIGVSKTLYLAWGLLAIAALIACYLYPIGQASMLLLSFLIGALLIGYAPKQQHDYYFSALIDGLLWLQALLVGTTAWW